MKWHVEGADADSGRDVILTIDAPSAGTAERMARRTGILISDVKPVPASSRAGRKRISVGSSSAGAKRREVISTMAAQTQPLARYEGYDASEYASVAVLDLDMDDAIDLAINSDRSSTAAVIRQNDHVSKRTQSIKIKAAWADLAFPYGRSSTRRSIMAGILLLIVGALELVPVIARAMNDKSFDLESGIFFSLAVVFFGLGWRAFYRPFFPALIGTAIYGLFALLEILLLMAALNAHNAPIVFLGIVVRIAVITLLVISIFKAKQVR